MNFALDAALVGKVTIVTIALRVRDARMASVVNRLNALVILVGLDSIATKVPHQRSCLSLNSKFTINFNKTRTQEPNYPRRLPLSFHRSGNLKDAH